MSDVEKFQSLDDILEYLDENFDEGFHRFITRMMLNKGVVRAMSRKRVIENFPIYGTYCWNHPPDKTILDSFEEGADGPVYETMGILNPTMSDFFQLPDGFI